MNKEVLISKYKNNSIAKKGRITLINLLNYFIVFVFSFILSTAIFNPIAASLPISQQINGELSKTILEMSEIVGETRIQEYSSDTKRLISVDSTKRDYLEALCKTSLYINNEKYNGKDVNINETFLMTGYQYDNLTYYYQVVKQNFMAFNDLSSYVYENIDYSNSEATRLMFQYEKVMDYSNEAFKDFFISQEEYDLLPSEHKSGSRYKTLTKDFAKYLRDYLLYSRSGGIENQVYDYLSSSYYKAVEYGRNEIENNLIRYVEKQVIVTDDAKKFTVIHIISNTIAFTLAFGIIQFVLPLLVKKWKYENAGFVIMKAALTTSDENEISVGSYVFYSILKYVICYSSIILSFAFSGILQLSGLNLGGGFNYFGLLMGCLLFALIDSVFVLINKKNQDFTLFVTSLILKDKRAYEGPSKEENNGRDEQ